MTAVNFQISSLPSHAVEKSAGRLPSHAVEKSRTRRRPSQSRSRKIEDAPQAFPVTQPKKSRTRRTPPQPCSQTPSHGRGQSPAHAPQEFPQTPSHAQAPQGHPAHQPRPLPTVLNDSGHPSPAVTQSSQSDSLLSRPQSQPRSQKDSQAATHPVAQSQAAPRKFRLVTQSKCFQLRQVAFPVKQSKLSRRDTLVTYSSR